MHDVDSQSAALSELVTEYRGKRIERRDFFRKAVELGMSVAAATMMTAEASAQLQPKPGYGRIDTIDAGKSDDYKVYSGSPMEVRVDINVRGLRVSDSDLEEIVKNFESSLVTAITTDNPQQAMRPKTKTKKKYEYC
jgi:ribosomal protein L12E/L44/L45/RPP1/RPP2